ncbi:hypothetical protein L208DRAFT_1406542, partial [Tricholoma matsutake]
MYADIEALVLSGELFNGSSRSSSPARSHSPDAGWHDDKISPETKRRIDQGYDYDSDDQRRDAQKAKESQAESIGMGPGRTGVKGVIRDRDEAEALERDQHSREVDEMQRRLEKSHLGGKTFLEEEREKAALGFDNLVDPLVMKELQASEERRKDLFGGNKDRRFGHLREVGLKGFVAAVEEERAIWVVVHIYEPSLERCYALDDTLSHLARLYPDTKFLRARAAALGFVSTTSLTQVRNSRIQRPPRLSLHDRDDDDPYDDDEDSEENTGKIIEDEDGVDLDMLPTMLVYRGGELVHNWVRVDWEAGDAGLEELLDRHHILPRSQPGLSSNLGLPSDEDDFDIIWSDDDEDYDN